jgi:hypothetical protein
MDFAKAQLRNAARNLARQQLSAQPGTAAFHAKRAAELSLELGGASETIEDTILLAVALVRCGRNREASVHIESTSSLLTRYRSGLSAPTLVHLLCGIGQARLALAQDEAAEATFQDAYATGLKRLGPEHPLTLVARKMLRSLRAPDESEDRDPEHIACSHLPAPGSSSHANVVITPTERRRSTNVSDASLDASAETGLDSPTTTPLRFAVRDADHLYREGARVAHEVASSRTTQLPIDRSSRARLRDADRYLSAALVAYRRVLDWLDDDRQAESSGGAGDGTEVPRGRVGTPGIDAVTHVFRQARDYGC